MTEDEMLTQQIAALRKHYTQTILPTSAKWSNDVFNKPAHQQAVATGKPPASNAIGTLIAPLKGMHAVLTARVLEHIDQHHTSCAPVHHLQQAKAYLDQVIGLYEMGNV